MTKRMKKSSEKKLSKWESAGVKLLAKVIVRFYKPEKDIHANQLRIDNQVFSETSVADYLRSYIEQINCEIQPQKDSTTCDINVLNKETNQIIPLVEIKKCSSRYEGNMSGRTAVYAFHQLNDLLVFNHVPNDEPQSASETSEYVEKRVVTLEQVAKKDHDLFGHLRPQTQHNIELRAYESGISDKDPRMCNARFLALVVPTKNKRIREDGVAEIEHYLFILDVEACSRLRMLIWKKPGDQGIKFQINYDVLMKLTDEELSNVFLSETDLKERLEQKVHLDCPARIYENGEPIYFNDPYDTSYM